jgi:hypothetical protein
MRTHLSYRALCDLAADGIEANLRALDLKRVALENMLVDLRNGQPKPRKGAVAVLADLMGVPPAEPLTRRIPRLAPERPQDPLPKPKRRKLTKAERAAIGLRAKARWADWRKRHGKPPLKAGKARG